MYNDGKQIKSFTLYEPVTSKVCRLQPRNSEAHNLGSLEAINLKETEEGHKKLSPKKYNLSRLISR